MNLGKRIQLRLAEIGKGAIYLRKRIPGLSSSTLSLTIKRDNRRSKWEVEIAEALGVHLTWLKTGQLPKLLQPNGDSLALSRQIAGLVLERQSVQAAFLIIENMNEKERQLLSYFMERLERP